jgi:uncharacterized membrane protein (DUF2068 family)
MADPQLAPRIILSAKQVKELESAKDMIKNAKRELEVLKKLGMNVQMLEDKLTWAEEVQSTLLEEFGE